MILFLIRIFTLFIFYLLILGNGIIIASPLGWEKSKLLIKSGMNPSIAFNNKNIFLVYTKKVINTKRVFFIKSTNNGKNWDKEIEITFSRFDSINPLILYANRRVYIFWQDYRDGNSEIYFTYSKDEKGEEFEKAMRVTINNSDSIMPTVVTSGDKIYLIWSDDKTGEYELYLKSYDLINDSWDEEIQITKYSGGSLYPSAIALMDEIYLVWQQREGNKWKIMYSRTENGKKWLKPINLSGGINNSFSPFLSTSSSGISVVFQGERDSQFDVYLITINIVDDTFSIPLNITRTLNIERYPVMINTLENKSYIFWLEYNGVNNQIFAMDNIDDKIVWTNKKNISLSKGNIKNFKSIYNSFNNDIYLVWEEKENSRSMIYFKKRDTFCPPPVIVSSSHEENKWSIKKDIYIKWKTPEDDSGIKDFAYILDHKSDTIPELYLVEYPINSVRFYNIKDGIWYFHLRARDNALNVSKTIHYKIMINSRMFVATEKFYVVKTGDTLWKIASKFYKNPRYFKAIGKYNNLDNPKWIYPHQILRLPSKKVIKKIK